MKQLLSYWTIHCFNKQNSVQQGGVIGGYRPDIDGLRSLAVLSVFLYHLQPQLLPGGYLGVDIFFVISGYLITNILIRQNQQGTFSFSNFYARRIKRIFPALFVVIFLFTPLAVFSLTPETYSNYIRSARYAAGQLSNFFFSRKVGYFDEGFQSQPLLHTWSLGVEEQFYLFWPLLLYVCYIFFRKKDTAHTLIETKSIDAKTGIILSFAAVFSYAACYFLAVHNYQLAFYMFYSRAWEFCIGGILCLGILPLPKKGLASHLTGIVGISLIFFSFFFIKNDFLGHSFLQFGAIFPCLGSALLIHLRPESSIANKIIAARIPVGIGKISYSLYLYHWPVIIFWQFIFNVYELDFFSSTIIIIIAFILSILSYFFVEQPARKSSLQNRTVILSGLVIALSFVVSCKILEKYDTAAWRVEKRSTAVQNMQYHQIIPNICVGKQKNGVQYFECNVKDKETPLIALVGDSHAPHFLQAATAWAKANGYGVRYLGRPGCPMLLGDINLKSYIDPCHETNCYKVLPFFATDIVEDPKVKIVVFAQRFDLFYDGKGYLANNRQLTFVSPKGNEVSNHTEYYREALSSTIDSIKKLDKRVVIVQQVPVFNQGKECRYLPLLKSWLSLQQPCSYDFAFLKKWQQPSRDFVTSLAEQKGANVIDVFQYFQTPLLEGESMYVDKDHLNGLGCKYIIPFFVEELDRILENEKSIKEE